MLVQIELISLCLSFILSGSVRQFAWGNEAIMSEGTDFPEVLRHRAPDVITGISSAQWF